jgi:hypothetical protein
MLSPGKYITRSSRSVLLTEPFSREKTRPDGKGGVVSIPVTGFRGTIMKADGSTPDTAAEWEDTLLPNTLGVFYQPHAVEGQASPHDLVSRVG